MTFLLTFDGVLEKYSYGISSIAASDASVRVAGQAQRDPPDERRALRGSPRFREQVAHPSRPLRPGIESICLLARPPPPRRARLIEQPQVLPPRSAAVRARARTAADRGGRTCGCSISRARRGGGGLARRQIDSIPGRRGREGCATCSRNRGEPRSARRSSGGSRCACPATRTDASDAAIDDIP